MDLDTTSVAMKSLIISHARAATRQLKSKKGQTLVEYALVLSFISVLTIIIMSALGVEVRGIYAPIIAALDQARQSIQ